MCVPAWIIVDLSCEAVARKVQEHHHHHERCNAALQSLREMADPESTRCSHSKASTTRPRVSRERSCPPKVFTFAALVRFCSRLQRAEHKGLAVKWWFHCQIAVAK